MNLTAPPVRTQADDEPATHAGVAVTISVLIPTRNRPVSLARALRALERQDRLPEEVIVVDASDAPLDEATLRASYGRLVLRCMRSPAGVCTQRNLGIRAARGSHVLLCDDDIEPPPEYLRRLIAYLEEQPTEGAVTGLVCEPNEAGPAIVGFTVPSLRHLWFAFIFQLTVWADVESAAGGRLTALPAAALKRWYARRGNSWSAAGWPLVTQVRGRVIHTAIYGLGAALVRRDWLLASPFDERLGTHGIGDNYGVALGFPPGSRVAVLTDLPVLHHRVAQNRLDPAEAHFQRVLALDYFLRTSGRFSRASTRWLAWSLVGKGVGFALRRRRDMFRSTVHAWRLIVSGRNPLVVAPRSAAEPPTARDP